MRRRRHVRSHERGPKSGSARQRDNMTRGQNGHDAAGSSTGLACAYKGVRLTHICIHVLTRMHTYTNTSTHRHVGEHARTHAHTHTHTSLTEMHTHVHLLTHIHTDTLTHTHNLDAWPYPAVESCQSGRLESRQLHAPGPSCHEKQQQQRQRQWHSNYPTRAQLHMYCETAYSNATQSRHASNKIICIRSASNKIHAVCIRSGV